MREKNRREKTARAEGKLSWGFIAEASFKKRTDLVKNYLEELTSGETP